MEILKKIGKFFLASLFFVTWFGTFGEGIQNFNVDFPLIILSSIYPMRLLLRKTNNTMQLAWFLILGHLGIMIILTIVIFSKVIPQEILANESS